MKFAHAVVLSIATLAASSQAGYYNGNGFDDNGDSEGRWIQDPQCQPRIERCRLVWYSYRTNSYRYVSNNSRGYNSNGNGYSNGGCNCPPDQSCNCGCQDNGYDQYPDYDQDSGNRYRNWRWVGDRWVFSGSPSSRRQWMYGGESRQDPEFYYSPRGEYQQQEGSQKGGRAYARARARAYARGRGARARARAHARVGPRREE